MLPKPRDTESWVTLSFSHDRCHKWVSDSDMMAVMGKVEGQGESWHGHVTAVTVAPEYRRQQLAKKLMNLLEDFSDKIDKGYFVDLFVRASNTPAIKMYEKLGYVIYRRVLRYYSGEEDGLDMRKALSRDVDKKSIIPLKRPVTPDELEYD
ncbi:N-terminal acetyltransferase B complex catalytic subunit NAA20 isoform X2 [Prunus dulcis]|uniref:N-terminal acetyltransferase B complex catalytic subunit NAA20 isoform X2 n=1 Tax=Prunus dulcis TaxID=3755 RepID=UPI001482295F|nr:N-terminal acetyltransferase B complex catalytic subunit NAA20 isoform X2 [Prunus dulcis]